MNYSDGIVIRWLLGPKSHRIMRPVSAFRNVRLVQKKKSTVVAIDDLTYLYTPPQNGYPLPPQTGQPPSEMSITRMQT